MIRYPFLIDQVLIRNPRNGTNIVLSRDEARRLYEQLGTLAMDMYEFSERNRTRCEAPHGFNHPLGFWTASDWTVAVMGELGEAANIIKKLNRVRDGIPGNKEMPDELRAALEDELADAYTYLDLLAQSQGIDLPRAIVRKFEAKSAEIGYCEDEGCPHYGTPHAHK